MKKGKEGIKIMVFSKNEIVKMLENNDSKSMQVSNKICLHLLKSVDNSTSFDIEYNEKSNTINRGSLVECIVKNALGLDNSKSQKAKCDIVGLKEVVGGRINNLEIKYSTRTSYASASKPHCKYVLLICEKGIALMDKKDLLLNSKGRVSNTIFNAIEKPFVEQIRQKLNYYGVASIW